MNVTLLAFVLGRERNQFVASSSQSSYLRNIFNRIPNRFRERRITPSAARTLQPRYTVSNRRCILGISHSREDGKMSENVEEMTDDGYLRRLLDESDDLEFRRRIRSRLRQLKKDASPAVVEIAAQMAKPQRSYLAPDRQRPVRIIEPKENEDKRQELVEKTSHLRSVARPANRPVSTTGAPQMESVVLRRSPRSSGVEPRRVDSSGARLEAVVLRKVETKTTKEETPRHRSHAEKVTPRAALERFKEMDLNSDAGRRYLEAGGGATARRRSPSPSSIRDQMLNWCRARVSNYEDIVLEDFSSSWNDGMAFCALIHSFYPEAFDYEALDRKDKAKNFQLAFDTAQKVAGVYPLLDVEDMVATDTPDWKCVFTYVNSIANRMSEIRKEKKLAEERERDKELGQERPEEEKEEEEENSA